jgi:hypothetical protein
MAAFIAWQQILKKTYKKATPLYRLKLPKAILK